MKVRLCLTIMHINTQGYFAQTASVIGLPSHLRAIIAENACQSALFVFAYPRRYVACYVRLSALLFWKSNSPRLMFSSCQSGSKFISRRCTMTSESTKFDVSTNLHMYLLLRTLLLMPASKAQHFGTGPCIHLLYTRPLTDGTLDFSTWRRSGCMWGPGIRDPQKRVGI